MEDLTEEKERLSNTKTNEDKKEDILGKDSINVEKALKQKTQEQDKDENDTPVETENMNIPEEDDTPPSGPSIDIQESNVLLITIHNNYGTDKHFL